MKYILSKISKNISNIILNINPVILEKVTEIRLRRNAPIILVLRNNAYFINDNGEIFDEYIENAVICSADDLDESFMQLCDYSIYNNMENMKKGFITLQNGARIGVASTCVIDENSVISVKNITSLNIRIPREFEHCSDKILNFLYINSFPSIIVAGKPNSGKTTFLRDMAKQLSSGFNNRYRKVTIIDERNEFCAKNESEISLNVGLNTDVLTNFPKPLGIEIATRTLSPEMIICDEISTKKELESIAFAFSSGIKFALSIHIGDKLDLFKKQIVKDLIKTNEFSYIVWLDDYTYNAEVIDINDVSY